MLDSIGNVIDEGDYARGMFGTLYRIESSCPDHREAVQAYSFVSKSALNTLLCNLTRVEPEEVMFEILKG